MNKKFLLALAIPVVLLGIVFNAGAHGGVDDDHFSSTKYLAAAFIAKDEAVAPEKLGVGAPSVLPGNPFYFIKNVARGLQTTFAFSDGAKAELKLRFASEKIVETQILLDRGDKKRATENLKSYEKDLGAAKEFAGKAKEGKSKLVEKFISEAFKHQAVIDKAEKDITGEGAISIKELREKTISYIAEVVAGAESAEKAKEALVSAMGDAGSPFKPLRNLEILKAIEEKAPEQAKAGIQLAQENAVKRFKNDYEKSTDEEKEALTEYIKGAGGDASRYVETFSKNKEILGQELSGKLLSAGEEKKVAEEEKLGIFASAVRKDECFPPVSPKPNMQAQSEVGTMTITPEISEATKENTITIEVRTYIDSLSVGMSRRDDEKLAPQGIGGVIDWGPKLSELPKGGEGFLFQGTSWETHDYYDANGRPQKRPRLPAQKYWIKIKASDQTTEGASDKNIGSYGWRKIEYGIHYVVGDAMKQSDFKTVEGNGAYYIGGPQYPVGKIVRVGNNAEPHYGKSVTVKAGETFEIEAKPTGWQGGTLYIPKIDSGRIIGPQNITVKSGESAIWKVFPKGTNPVKGSIYIKNNCNHIDPYETRPVGTQVGTFEAPITYDFKGLAKEKAELTFHRAIATVLEFGKPESALNITPALSYMDDQIVAARVPDFTLEVQAVYKDNPQEIVKNIFITPKGKGQLAGSATAVTNKDGETFFKITAPNVTKEEVTRGILLKATAPAIPGLQFETKLLFTGISIEVTKPVPTVEPTVEKKPYNGSPPLMY